MVRGRLAWSERDRMSIHMQKSLSLIYIQHHYVQQVKPGMGCSQR